MKFLKYLFAFVIVVLLAAGLYVLFQPNEYNISRSKIIDVPVKNAFNAINNLKTYEQWGPWHDEDSTIVVTYGDKTIGVGASDSWTSKDGPGKMWITAVEDSKAIHQEMQFGDWEPSEMHWTFENVDGRTKVTWSMNDDSAPLMFKVFAALSGGWDAMFGPMQEKGLNNLENYLKKQSEMENSFSLSKITKNDKAPKKLFIGYLQKGSTDASLEETTKLYQTYMPKVGKHAATIGLKDTEYIPGTVFLKWDETTKETEFCIGFFVDKNVSLASGMESITIAAGKTVQLSKFGKYGIGDYEAHTKIGKYLEENKLEAKGLVWEVFVNDPMQVKPQEIQTDIFYEVK